MFRTFALTVILLSVTGLAQAQTPGSAPATKDQVDLILAELKGIRGDIGSIKDDIKTIKADLADLKKVVERHDTEIRALRAEIDALKARGTVMTAATLPTPATVIVKVPVAYGGYYWSPCRRCWVSRPCRCYSNGWYYNPYFGWSTY